MEENVYLAALAGLIHDIGKFAMRAGIHPVDTTFTKEDYGDHGYHALLSHDFLLKYIPEKYQKSLASVLFHHRYDLDDPEIRILRIADQLAAGERRTGTDEISEPQAARLIPVLTSVSIGKAQDKNIKSAEQWRFGLSPLTADNEKVIFPTKEQEGDYRNLWEKLIDDLDQWKNGYGPRWNEQSIFSFYFTLLHLFYKYTWCIPSATPWQKGVSNQPQRAYPDVSLYDHARISSAIAACLVYDNNKNLTLTTSALLIARGDVSGIQNYIYRITRPEAETEHVAKRLRGRSFYIQLLTELIVDWLLREIGLPPSCAIFVGGGRFDLLLPLSAKSKLEELVYKLEEWVLREFNGEIGIWVAVEKADSSDLNDLSHISQRLDDDLERIKQTKWIHELKRMDFFEPSGAIWHVCPVCQLTPMPESGNICQLCQQQELIGKYLPHTHFIAYCYGNNVDWKKDQLIDFRNTPFHVTVALIRNSNELEELINKQYVNVLYKINQTQDFIFPGVASGFRFLATEAPKALKSLTTSDGLNIESGDVLPFESIAELSQGASRLGILMADVDNLGFVMSEGLKEDDISKPKDQLMRPTLSRVASLSRTLDLFFAGYINQICRDIFAEWKQDQNEEQHVDGLFYVMYSGGDDLFIVGPWDQVLILAMRIEEKFRKYVGDNPDLTLSAGFVQVKPRFPVQKFSELVREAESAAKSNGRNRIHLFGESVRWWKNSEGQSPSVDFKWLYALTEDWLKAIKDEQIHRGLIYNLGVLFRQHRTPDGKLKPLWTPQLYYTLSRRLKQETFEAMKKDLFYLFLSGKTLVAVSIASLKMRERR